MGCVYSDNKLYNENEQTSTTYSNMDESFQTYIKWMKKEKEYVEYYSTMWS